MHPNGLFELSSMFEPFLRYIQCNSNYVISTVFDSVRLMTQILFIQIPFQLQKGNKGNIQVELLQLMLGVQIRS